MTSAPQQILPADRCWYCGVPFTSLAQMQAVAQNVGGPSAIRWTCHDGDACGKRCRETVERYR